MNIRSLFALLFLSVAPLKLMAQDQRAHEIAFDYTYVHTNAPPGGCGCFSMNGGGGSYAYHFGPQFAMVADIEAVHAANIDHTNADLMLTSYLAGPRFYYRRPKTRLAPYGQTLLGAVRATGGLAPANSNGEPSSTVFGATVGGGLEYTINHTVALRLVEADYFVTTFDNGVNGRQNNLRITAGILFRLGRGESAH
jgi:outer membrane immunogenic protein